MGGLLVDTLSYNFLNSNNDCDEKSFLYYDWMSRDFFKYISELAEQDDYLAPGSRQRVKVKKKFQRKAKKAYELCLEAIEAGDQDNAHSKWKKIFGRPFPAAAVSVENLDYASTSLTWKNTEEL